MVFQCSVLIQQRRDYCVIILDVIFFRILIKWQGIQNLDICHLMSLRCYIGKFGFRRDRDLIADLVVLNNKIWIFPFPSGKIGVTENQGGYAG